MGKREGPGTSPGSSSLYRLFGEEGLAEIEGRPDVGKTRGWVGRQGKRKVSLPSRRKEPSPRPWQETQRSREGLGGAGAQDHPPFLADEQEQEHDQARDECQADPNDGPGVIVGPCRETGVRGSQPWPRAQGSGGSPCTWWAASSVSSAQSQDAGLLL